jgi:tryptophan synthase beta chain
MQDEDGQITEAHSVSAGLDYPGAGPEHAWLRDTGRARYLAVDDDEALDAFRRGGPAGGHHPRRSRRRTPCTSSCSRRPSTLDVVCLSGRGDKDLAEVLARTAP